MYNKNYVRLDNIFEGYDFYVNFEYLREEAECQGFTDDYECQNFINELLEKDRPEFFKWMEYNIEEDILAEYHEFEEDDDGYTGYAVYLHISERLRKSVEKCFPEYFLFG